MESLSLTTATTNASKFRFSIPCSKPPQNYRNLPFPHKRHRKLLVFAAKDEDKLTDWDKMELKFGKLIGEDPKLTLAKIVGKKLNPELSYLEIEKLYNKKGNKALNNDIEEVPFDVSDIRRKPNDSLAGLNLTRPVPKKGVKFEQSDKPVAPKVKRPNQPTTKAPNQSVPNVTLRKPTTFKEDDLGAAMLPRPNLSMKVSKEPKEERVMDMNLVRKPDPFLKREETEATVDDNESLVENQTEVSLLQKPEIIADQESMDQNGSRSADLGLEMENVVKLDLEGLEESGDALDIQDVSQKEDRSTESQPSEKGDIGFAEKSSTPNIKADLTTKISLDTALIGPPKRLDQSVKVTPDVGRGITGPTDPSENEKLPTMPLLKEREDIDWKRAEDLIETKGKEEVELINSSTRGFVASFGSLIGFLPYRNLATKWKYLAFESWLRKKGLDPAMYRQNLGVIGGYNATSKTIPELSIDPKKIEGEISSNMKLEELLAIYDQEKLKYLSSFVGQKIRVNVVLVDKESKKLIFSAKPKEKEEAIERKRSLMAKLSVGDFVKCCIKKITYYGIFVEVEGVPALIHQTEVSWDDTLDPTSYFKIGQVVEAKVHQLDFSLERIFLSLKEITTDPLIDALEAVVGDHADMDGRLQAAEPDTEWVEVESLVKELQRTQGIELVKKGRFFLSPGLAPTFQVYMASVFESEYKLLARAGNKVQEVIVQTSMGKEEMKTTILTCANRVE